MSLCDYMSYEDIINRFSSNKKKKKGKQFNVVQKWKKKVQEMNFFLRNTLSLFVEIFLVKIRSERDFGKWFLILREFFPEKAIKYPFNKKVLKTFAQINARKRISIGGWLYNIISHTGINNNNKG